MQRTFPSDASVTFIPMNIQGAPWLQWKHSQGAKDVASPHRCNFATGYSFICPLAHLKGVLHLHKKKIEKRFFALKKIMLRLLFTVSSK